MKRARLVVMVMALIGVIYLLGVAFADMKTEQKTNPDGSVSFEITVPKDEAGNFSASSGGNDYCCHCTNGKTITVHAGNGVFAAAKCVAACGNGFSMGSGKC